MENPSLEQLIYRAFPEIAAALRARIEPIVQRWQRVVKETLPHADELTFAQIRDDLPGVLEHMAKALESNRPRHTQNLMDASSAHGEVRYHEGYNINELLIEYDLLRPIVIEEVAAQLKRELTTAEAIALNMGIDTAARQGVVNFAQHQADSLKSSADAQSKFLSFLSHDLRGRLNAVLLTMEVLRRELAPHPQFNESAEDIEQIRRSTLETVETMSRFLEAEKLRHKKIEVKLAPVDLKSLAAGLNRQFAQEAKRKGVELCTEVLQDCTPTSDAALLNTILQNLVSNAVKYSRKGAVRVTITAPNGKSCRITVADQGPGIAADVLPKLFVPFSRGETHGEQGVGLGLSIARQAADLLNAKLWAESKVGEGTAFHVELPK